MLSIDLEAHYYTKAVFGYLQTRKHFPKFVKEAQPNAFNLRFTEQISLFQNTDFIEILCDVEARRLKAMDEADLDVQVLSFSSPGIDEFAPDYPMAEHLAVELNDFLFETIQRNPTRFMGFATISPYDVPKSVKELERAVTSLNFVGWLVHSNFGEQEYLDNRKYWPLLEAAEQLDIPIYLHPTTPLSQEYGKYGFALGGPPMGFQFETALCFLRMVYAGVFDEFPNLKIILGHMGETLPFLYPDRIDWAYANPNVSNLPGFIKLRPDIKRNPSEVIAKNVYVTTSGRFSKPLLDYVLGVMGEDKVMFASDYPYENLKQSIEFIRSCDLSDEIFRDIFSGNAQQLGMKIKFS